MPISGKIKIQIDEAAERGDVNTIVSLLDDLFPGQNQLVVSCEEGLVSAVKLFLTQDFVKDILLYEKDFTSNLLDKIDNSNLSYNLKVEIGDMVLAAWTVEPPAGLIEKINLEVSKGNAQEVLRLLRDSINGKESDPLFIACGWNIVGAVRLLLSLPSKTFKENWENEAYQYKIFSCLIMKNCLESLDILLKSKRFNINCLNAETGEAPLNCACRLPNVRIVKRLLEEPDINVNNASNENLKERSISNVTPLISSCMNGRNDIAKLLLDHPNINVNYVGSRKLTALHHAGVKCDVSVMRKLILKGADLRAECEENDMTPDTYAELKSTNKATCKFIKVVKMLRCALNTEISRNNQTIRLFYSIMIENNQEVRDILTRNPALLNEAEGFLNTYISDTPLIRACRFGCLEAVRIILSMCYNPNTPRQGDGVTALYVASQGGYADIADCLLRAGAAPNQATTDGDNETPLIAASFYGHVDVVNLLIARGADVTHRTASGGNALQIAEHYGHSKVYWALQQVMAQKNIAEKENTSGNPVSAVQQPTRSEQAHFEAMQRTNHAVLTPTVSKSSADYASAKSKHKHKNVPQPAMVDTGYHKEPGCCIS